MRLRLVVALSLSIPWIAQTARLSPGLEHFYNLEYDEAIAEFRRQIASQPGAADQHNHLAMSILYREMFRSGALESELVSGTNPFLRRPKMNPSPADESEFESAVSRSIAASQARLDSSPNDAQALYTLGVAYGLRANYNFLVRKSYMQSLRDATTARKLHNKVTELEPSNMDARLIQGVHDFVVGSLPWYTRALGFLAGVHGNKETGIRTLEEVGRKGNQNDVDAQVLLCAIYRRERSLQKAVSLLERLIPRFPRNYLLRFELAQMQADLIKPKEALAVLQEMENLKAAGDPGYARLPIEKIQYARGVIQFWYNDLEQAAQNLKRVTARVQDLDLNTGVYAWLRLGQTYDLNGQRTLAIEAYRQAVRMAPQSDAAKECRQYLAVPYRRGKTKG
jgi:tetratricopeptide (TPR) repeat protein